MSTGTRVYRIGGWTIYVPESLLSQEDGKYFIDVLGTKEGPFETEQDLALWLLDNRTKTINAGVMTEYATPPEFISLCTDSREDVLKIMTAFVGSGIQFQYVPQTIESVFIYMVLIRKEDRKAADHAMKMIE